MKAETKEKMIGISKFLLIIYTVIAFALGVAILYAWLISITSWNEWLWLLIILTTIPLICLGFLPLFLKFTNFVIKGRR